MGYLQIRDKLRGIINPKEKAKDYVPKFNSVEHMGSIFSHVKNLENFKVDFLDESDFLVLSATNFSLGIPKKDILDILDCTDMGNSFQIMLKNRDYIKVKYTS